MRPRLVRVRRAHIGRSGSMSSANAQERKAMFFPDSERAPEVYELAQDPGEKQDLASRQAAWLEAIQPAKQAWEDKAADWQLEHQLAPGVRDWKRLSEEERNLMIDLGYVDPEEFADESKIIQQGDRGASSSLWRMVTRWRRRVSSRARTRPRC